MEAQSDLLRKLARSAGLRRQTDPGAGLRALFRCRCGGGDSRENLRRGQGLSGFSFDEPTRAEGRLDDMQFALSAL